MYSDHYRAQFNSIVAAAKADPMRRVETLLPNVVTIGTNIWQADTNPFDVGTIHDIGIPFPDQINALLAWLMWRFVLTGSDRHLIVFLPTQAESKKAWDNGGKLELRAIIDGRTGAITVWRDETGKWEVSSHT